MIGKTVASPVSEEIDTPHKADIMTPEEVAQFLRKSPSWVYKNRQLLGGVKLGGSLFFPKKEDLYECLFKKGQRVAVRLHTERSQTHPSLVQNQNRGQTGRSRKKKGGIITTEGDSDHKRHGIFGVSQQKT